VRATWSQTSCGGPNGERFKKGPPRGRKKGRLPEKKHDSLGKKGGQALTPGKKKKKI